MNHDLPVGHFEGHPGLGEPHTGQQLEDWFNINHRCRNCHRVIRTTDQMNRACNSLVVPSATPKRLSVFRRIISKIKNYLT